MSVGAVAVERGPSIRRMIDRLHDDEVPVDLALVRSLLIRQHPRFADLELRPAPEQGTDNVVFRLGDDLAVRLPRKSTAVPSLLVERRWLPKLAPALPLEVPLPVAVGEPDEGYPFPWSVCLWLPGEPVGPADLNAADADRLAGFVSALEAQDAAAGPRVRPGQRAARVADYDERFRTSVVAFRAAMSAGQIDTGPLTWPRWNASGSPRSRRPSGPGRGCGCTAI